MTWHRYVVTCPKCNREIAITRISFAADANILLEGVCVNDGLTVAKETTFAKQVTNCYLMDKDETGLLFLGNALVN